jgi:hypothetical protein
MSLFGFEEANFNGPWSGADFILSSRRTTQAPASQDGTPILKGLRHHGLPAVRISRPPETETHSI